MFGLGHWMAVVAPSSLRRGVAAGDNREDGAISMSVNEVDFGREAARAMARLLGMVEEQEAAIRADPVPAIYRAMAKVDAAMRVLREAEAALRPEPPRFSSSAIYDDHEPLAVVRVRLVDWKRLKDCADLVKHWERRMAEIEAAILAKGPQT